MGFPRGWLFLSGTFGSGCPKGLLGPPIHNMGFFSRPGEDLNAWKQVKLFGPEPTRQYCCAVHGRPPGRRWTKPGAATAAAPAAPVAARVLRLPVMSGHHRHRAFLTIPAPSLRRLHYEALSADRRDYGGGFRVGRPVGAR